jgi:hypothetical protein
VSLKDICLPSSYVQQAIIHSFAAIIYTPTAVALTAPPHTHRMEGKSIPLSLLSCSVVRVKYLYVPSDTMHS